ncbi:MAG: hypothetical protein JWM85_597 [Acidimicrobiaceae bacterium]|nr:hypothetical protein [Acidimicrobiaceae bacterium]
MSITHSRSSLAAVPPASPASRIRSDWVDRFLGSDPGLNRIRIAAQGLLTIGLILAAELVFVDLTHALQAPISHAGLATEAAAAARSNHEFLVIAEILGALVGMISTFAVTDATARGQLMSTVLLPVAMLPALAFGITIGAHRTVALVLLAVVLAVGTYLRRFGPRGVAAGSLLFTGYFLGFFLHAGVAIGDFGWLAAEIGIGLVVASAVRFAIFYPRQAKALERIQRSYGARSRKVAALALELFEDPSHGQRAVRRLQHHLVRLNEAALMTDAQLGDPSADGSSTQLLHQCLFDMEVAITNIARFAQAMARLDLPTDQRSAVRLALKDIVRRDAAGARDQAANLFELLRKEAVPQDEERTRAVLVHRFAGSVVALTEAGIGWSALGKSIGDGGTFQPSVLPFGGGLPGSAQTSAAASLESSTRFGDVRLAPYTRAAIQIGIAVGGAIFLGVQISSYRFYWAAIAAFVTFVAAHNSGEQVRRGFLRVAGTVVGIGVGSLLADAVRHHTNWSIAVILIALFFGFYLLRVNYGFMVVGITVVVSQLYLDLGEFSNSLLWLRLEETAVGAAFATIVAVTVLPLRTRRVLRIAFRNHVEAIGRLVDHASGQLLGEDQDIEPTLHADAREIDAAYQALVATARPLRRTLGGRLDGEIGWVMLLASASRHYSRNLVADVEALGPLDDETRVDIERASSSLRQSLSVVVAAVTGPRDVVYTRSSALFDRAERRLEEYSSSLGGGQLAIRDLMLIDGAMARSAELMGLAITDYDTVGPTFGGAADDGLV